MNLFKNILNADLFASFYPRWIVSFVCSFVWLTIFCTVLYGTPTEMPRYEDVFTDEIYDQSRINWSQYNSDPEEEKNAAKEELLKLKKASVVRLMARTVKKLIDDQDELVKGEKDRRKNDKHYQRLATWASASLNFIPVVGGFLADATRSEAHLGTDDPRYNVAMLEQEIAKLRYQQNSMFEGLEFEPIAKEEEKYVWLKRFISLELQDVIEDALIQSRKRGVPIYNIRDFIAEALTLPVRQKKLLHDSIGLKHLLERYSDEAYLSSFSPKVKVSVQRLVSDVGVERLLQYWKGDPTLSPDETSSVKRLDKHVGCESLLNKFNQDVFFSALDTNVQGALRRLIADTYFSSLADEGSEIPLKKFYYFWGNPGVGKSDAAKRILDFLGLPYFEAYIRVDSDLTQDNLEGTTWYRMDSKKGWVISPLMARNTDNETFSNAFLIIQDFDRIFLSSGPRGEAAVGFLLDYLDPLKSHFYSPYFKSSIKISRLSIILNGNKPIPTGDGGPSDRFAALRERLTIVHFPDPDENLCKIILRHYSEVLYPHFSIQTMDSAELETLIDATIATSQTRSIRDLKNRLKAQFLAMTMNENPPALVEVNKPQKNQTSVILETDRQGAYITLKSFIDNYAGFKCYAAGFMVMFLISHYFL